MAGAGIVSLSLSGRHDSELARKAGDWLLKRPFSRYNEHNNADFRYFYGGFYASQATYQLGGRWWQGCYPDLASALLDNQKTDGSWHPESNRDRLERRFGSTYSTSLAVLALTPPYQLLPVFQR